MASRPKPKTAHGQRLADFLPLLPAEEILREACRIGEEAMIGTGRRPEADSSEIHIRADVLRVFCIDHDPDAPVHEHGVRLFGAWIAGNLDLDGCIVSHPLWLMDCHLEGSASLFDTSARQLGFDGSIVLGIDADRLNCNGGVFLRRGFVAMQEVRLLGAAIGGNFDCSQGSFLSPNGYALRFDGAKISGSVFLGDRFVAKSEVRLLGATIGGRFYCSEGRFEAPSGDALNFDSVKISGGVLLNKGFVSTRQVSLLGATIGGNLECSRGNFEAMDGDALSFDRAEISGSAFLDDGFVAKRQVRLLGAFIGGNLQCDNGSFEASDGSALAFDGAKIAGDVCLKGGFVAKGEVRFPGATISGNLECSESTLEASSDVSLGFDSAKILGSVFLNKGFTADRDVRFLCATIGGNLSCRGGSVGSLRLERAQIAGSLQLDGAFHASNVVDLGHAEIGVLADEPASWTDPTFILDGLTWRRFGGQAPVDAKARISWLERQPATHLGGSDFRPQPWEQCAKVLAEMGHEREATKIRIEKRKRMRWLDWRRTPSPWARAKCAPSIIFDFILWLTVAYGYRPLLAGLWLLGLWIAASLAFTSLVPPTVMTPTDTRVYLASTIPDTCRDDWISFDPPIRPTDTPQRIRWSETFRLPIDDRGGLPVPAPWREICTRAMPSEYTTFSPWVYTLDLLLPIVDLRQEKDWAPRVTDANGDTVAPIRLVANWGLDWGWGHVTRFGEWSLILLGWFFSALLLGAVTGLIRRD